MAKQILACILIGLASVVFAQTGQDHAHQHGATSQTRPVELGTSTAFDQQGVLWAVSKEVADDGKPSLALQTSANFGKSWSPPRSIVQEPVAARGDERPKIAFGPAGELYLLYTSPAGQKNPHIGDIRFVRSTDGGKSFSAPLTVHANRDAIVHSFGSMVVDKKGRIFVAWIDSRDRDGAKARQQAYTGNAVYYAVSTDGGKTFNGDFKVADHSCECCRIALSLDAQGQPVMMWRHVFEPDVRDHAVAVLAVDGSPPKIDRATFDDWRVEACPHHGPSLAFGPDGRRHQVWFNGRDDDKGGVHYATSDRAGQLDNVMPLGSARAAYADVMVQGQQIAIVWKDFDGTKTSIRSKLSKDNGKTWREKELASTTGDSDKPYLTSWRDRMILSTAPRSRSWAAWATAR